MFFLLKVKNFFEFNIKSPDVKHKKEKPPKQQFRQLVCGPFIQTL